jgi:hypothetical protein
VGGSGRGAGAGVSCSGAAGVACCGAGAWVSRFGVRGGAGSSRRRRLARAGGGANEDEECSYLAFHPRRSRLGGIDSFSFLFFVPRFQPWAGVPVGRLHAWFEFEYRWAWRNTYIRQPSRIRALRVRAAWPTFPAASDSVRHTGPDWAQAAGAILYFRGVTPWASLVPTPYAAAAAVSIPISTIDWFFPCRRRAQSQSQLLDKRQASPSRSRVIW